EYRAKADEWHHRLFEQLADHDEELMQKFVHEEEPTVDEMRRALRRATLDTTGERVLTPVLCGSAFKNKGVQQLLDAIVQYLPSPVDVPPIPGVDPKTGEEVVRRITDEEPFAALAFKIMSDSYVG